MSKVEFLRLTDWKTEESIYLDPSQIVLIKQLVAYGEYARRTRIDLISSSQVLLVTEEASQIALASGRGFLGINEPEVTL